MAQSKRPNALTVKQATERLSVFIKNNPGATIDRAARRKSVVAVKYPWNDRSIELIFPPHPEKLIDTLNKVILPERFTAIWHIDSKRLEIIYTTYPTHEVGRSFVFKHRGVDYKCRFDDSSSRLLLIAEWYFPIGPSQTYYRNLDTYSDYVLSKRKVRGYDTIPDARPISFWIDGMHEWKADAVLDLAHHLNFYMSYYDANSGQILLHSPVSETIAMQPEPHSSGPFPSVIKASPIEENLLHFWRASRDDSDPIRAFLNNYLILESAAFFYVDETVRRNIHKALIDPIAGHDIEQWTERILEAVGEKMGEEVRMQLLLKHCVDRQIIWQQFAKNLDFFCTEKKFHGGFKLEPMFTKPVSADQFPQKKWEQLFQPTIYRIRNALAHGKEKRSLATISPTTENFQLLEPWIPVIAAAAREVMVYRKLA